MGQQELPPVLVAGSSHLAFAKEIALHAGLPLSNVLLGAFPDGELFVDVQAQVRERRVFVIQTIARHPNRYLMQLLLIIDALKRASAKQIIAVIPYFGYGRQDRRDKPHVPITAKLVADLLEKAGVHHLLTMDLHVDQIQGFFNIPVDTLYARPCLIEAFLQKGSALSQCVVATPDVGSVKLCRAYARDLDVNLVIVDKQRVSAQEVKTTAVIGSVEGKDVLLADDVFSTGSTMSSAAKACHERGARRVFAAVSHGLFVGPALDRLERSPIEALFVGNTIPGNHEISTCGKIVPVSVALLFARAIQRICAGESVSSLCVQKG